MQLFVDNVHSTHNIIDNLRWLEDCVGDAVDELVHDAGAWFNAEQNVSRAEEWKQQRRRSDGHPAHIIQWITLYIIPIKLS